MKLINNNYSNHFLLITRLGFPIVVAQLGTIVTGFADTMMVGQYGTNELSAAGFTNNIFGLVIYFLLGFSYSTTPVVGAYYGRGSYSDAARTLKESVLANMSVCMIVVALMSILYSCLHLLGQPEELLPLMRPYFLVVLASMPFVSAFNALKQFCDGVGDTKMPMWIMIGGNVVNIIGNYLLIFGKMGCPELGLLGAGIATLLSRVMMALVLLLVIMKMRRYEIYREGFRKKMTREGVRHLSRKGLPIGLQMCMEASSFSLCAVMMGWIGAVPLAAHQIMCTVGSLCFMVYYGIGAAVAIRISHFCGQGQWTEVRRTANMGLTMTLVTGVFLSAFIFLLRVPIADLFTTSEEVVSMVVLLVVPMVFYQIGDCIQTVFANSLRAIEDVKAMMFHAFIAYIVVSLPLSYLFAFVFGLGAVGVWWAFPFGLTTAGILFWTRFTRTTGRKILEAEKVKNR